MSSQQKLNKQSMKVCKNQCMLKPYNFYKIGVPEVLINSAKVCSNTQWCSLKTWSQYQDMFQDLF